MSKNEQQQREALVASCRWMNAVGLNQGTSGNISVRHGDRMLITPSGIPYDAMSPEMIAAMPLSRTDGSWEGPAKPSSEWRFHLDILRARPDVGSVVHAHSPYATALAIARRDIPACHYMIAAFGGSDIRCSDYALFGTKQLSEAALKALAGRNGCLLANHGMIVAGSSLDKAMWLAVELEALAKQYTISLLVGGPVLLSAEEIEETKVAFATYGYAQPQTSEDRTDTRAKRSTPTVKRGSRHPSRA